MKSTNRATPHPLAFISPKSIKGIRRLACLRYFERIRATRIYARYQFLICCIAVIAAVGGISAGSPAGRRAQNAKTTVDSVMPGLERAQQLIQQGRLEDARSDLLRMLKAFPHRAELHNFLGVVEAEEGHPKAAELDFQEAIQESPHYSGAYLNLGHLYEGRISKDRDARLKAMAVYQQLLRFDPKNAEANYQLAALYEQTGQLKQARQTWEKVAATRPDAVSPLLSLAHVANQQHDFKGALGYLAHARALQPRNAGIHFFFGMVCVELNLQQEAYVSLKKAVQLNPDNPYYNYALGAVCTDREDAQEAIHYFKKYCAIKPQDPRGRLALGAAYYYSHDLKSARAILENLGADATTAAGASYYLGRVAKDEGRWVAASQDFERAIHSAPDFADAYAALGSVYLSQKDYPESEKALQRAIQLQPDNYLANLNLVALYERTNDKRAAAQEQRFAEVRKERNQRAKMFLRTIRVVP